MPARCPKTFQVNALLDRSILVPVLLLFGANDFLFTSEAPKQQAALYAGSRDVTLRIFPDTGHGLTRERSAPQVRDAVASWLREHGL